MRLVIAALAAALQAQTTLPSEPLVIRDFTLQFNPAGTFSLSGAGWPSMSGSWHASGNKVTLLLTSTLKDCTSPGTYSFAVEGQRVSFLLVSDECAPRRMILDRSEWLPRGVATPVPPRRIV